MTDEVLSSREALEKAFSSVPADEPASEPAEVAVADNIPPEPFAETSDRADDGRARDELGRFAPKEAVEPQAVSPIEVPQPVVEAAKFEPPSRFSADAKAAWDAAPLPIKAEITRAFGELEKGIDSYRQQIEPFKPFLDAARAQGVDPVGAIQNYQSIERELYKSLPNGLDIICRNAGTDLRTVAAHILGQPAPQRDAQVAQLEQELHGLRQKAQQYDTHLQREQAKQAQTVEKTVMEFSAAHPRFEELAPLMQGFLPNFSALPPAERLDAAYRLAEQIRPAAAQTSAAPTAAPQPQTPSGPVSIKGAPSSGSNPARAQQSMSSRDAVAAAFAHIAR